MTTDPMFGSAQRPAPASGAPAAPNPFAGIPVGDYLRDGAALLFLLLSLAMPWNISGWEQVNASSNLAVVLITILSLLSLTVTYLARAQVFGPSLSLAQAGLIRAAANVPYVLLVVVYLVFDLGLTDSYGLGHAMAFGLTGAALAGMPRAGEGPFAATSFQAVAMKFAAAGLAGLWALLAFVSLVRTVVDAFKYDVSIASTLMVILIMLVQIAAFAALAIGLFMGSQVARLLALIAGGALLGATVIAWMSGWELSAGLESTSWGGPLVIGMMTVGVAASSPATVAALKPLGDVQRYLRAAAWTLLAAGVLAVTFALATVLGLIDGGFTSTGAAVGYLVVLVLIAALAIVARVMLVADHVGQRLIVAALTGAMVLLGIVVVVLANSSGGVSKTDLVIAFGLPIAVLVCLFLPTPVREYYLTATPAQPAAPGAAVPPPATPDAPADAQADTEASPAAEAAADPEPAAAPVASAPVEPEPAVDAPAAAEPEPTPVVDEAPAPATPAEHPRAAEAADPATPATALYEIASTIPELRPAVAANPSTYPDLLTWLGSLGDPAVDAVLKPAAPAPVAHPRAAEAADPATPATALYEIASTIPELRPAVAANPSTYPDLVAWLGALGDPAVDAALAKR